MGEATKFSDVFRNERPVNIFLNLQLYSAVHLMIEDNPDKKILWLTICWLINMSLLTCLFGKSGELHIT